MKNFLIILLSCISFNCIAVEYLDDKHQFFNSKSEKLNFDMFEDKAIIVHFWATWCQHCFYELKKIDNLHKKYRKKPLQIITISEDFKKESAVEEYFQKHNIKNLEIYLDPKNILFKQLKMETIPSSIILDKEHKVISIINDNVDWDSKEILETIEEIVK